MKTHNQSSQLTSSNPTYRLWIKQYTDLEVKKDFGKGDLTSAALFKDDQRARAIVIVKEKGIFAGRQEIEFYLNKFTGLTYKFFKKDGDAIFAGDKILEINGNAKVLLKIERSILNLFGRMSGVATKTRRIVNKIKNSRVLVTPTRKTLWGLLDKRACALGGGGTHRLNLGDAVLIKDNHLDLLGRNIAKALSAFKKTNLGRFIEIEVENFDEAVQAAEELKLFLVPSFVMLDNMKPAEVRRVTVEFKKRGYKNIKLEVSGGINEKNVVAYATTGVNVISMGCLTKDAASLDFSMEMVK